MPCSLLEDYCMKEFWNQGCPIPYNDVTHEYDKTTWDVCAYMCVHVYGITCVFVYVKVCLHKYVPVCREQRPTLNCVLKCPLFCLLRKGLSLFMCVECTYEHVCVLDRGQYWILFLCSHTTSGVIFEMVSHCPAAHPEGKADWLVRTSDLCVSLFPALRLQLSTIVSSFTWVPSTLELRAYKHIAIWVSSPVTSWAFEVLLIHAKTQKWTSVIDRTLRCLLVSMSEEDGALVCLESSRFNCMSTRQRDAGQDQWQEIFVVKVTLGSAGILIFFRTTGSRV